MRATWVAGLGLLGHLGLGCVPAACPDAPSSTGGPNEVVVEDDGWIGSARSEPAAAGSWQPARAPAASPSQASAPAAEPARPPRRRPISLHLHDTALDEALRLVADAGHFDLVLDTSTTEPITLSLRVVEPFDALVILAESRGLHVAYRRGVVIVSP